MVKNFAYISMVLDHIGQVFLNNFLVFISIGRIALPFFAFGIAEGYRKTKKFKFYALRVLIVGIVAQYPYYLLFNNGHLNICFTFFVGLTILRIYNLKINLFLKFMVLSLLVYLAHKLNLEYGLYGISLIIIFFYIFLLVLAFLLGVFLNI